MWSCQRDSSLSASREKSEEVMVRLIGEFSGCDSGLDVGA